MKNFDGCSNLVNNLPEPTMDHVLWTKGCNTASGARALRILMPLCTAIDILENADVATFTLKHGIHTPIDHLRLPDTPVWWIKAGTLQKMSIRDVNDKVVRCKVVELPLNYHQFMVRYQLHNPPKGGRTNEKWFDRCSSYLKMWMELLIAEKRRQMHVSAEMWPRVPWPIKEVYSMPIVLWLSKERNERKRSAA